MQDYRLSRALFAIATMFVLVVNFYLFEYTTSIAFANEIAVCASVSSLILMFIAFTSQFKNENLYGLLLLGIFIVSYGALVYAHVHATAGYQTDELSFDQYAASLFLSGHNPYTQNLSHSLALFHVPKVFYTYTADGNIVNSLSYPALSVLIYVPFAFLGHYYAYYVDGLFWILSTILMYRFIPKPYQTIAILIGAFPLFMGLNISAMTDALMIPFLLLAMWKWDAYAKRDELRYRLLSPIMLGLAVCIKQTAWFVAPVMVLGIWKETKSVRRTLNYAAVGALSFFVPNLPFIVWNPKSWFVGVTMPFLHGVTPSGVGMVSLSIFNRLGGGNLSFYTLCALGVMGGLLYTMASHYERMKPLVFLIPSFVLFFPTRSFENYLVDLFPVFIVSLFALETGPVPALSRRKFTLASLSFAPALAFGVLAISVHPALYIVNAKVINAHRVEVTVQNTGSKPLQPHFTVMKSPVYMPFWRIVRGPTLLPEHAATTYLLASRVPLDIGPDKKIIVDAFSSGSRLSTSKLVPTVVQPLVQ